MREYTDQEITSLLAMPKRIVEPPKKKMRSENGSLRNDMQLVSHDGQHAFGVFMRVNERFPENFSIGLDYVPQDEPSRLCLLRCNGPHGSFVGDSEAAPHFQFHVHRAKSENLREGLRAERGGEPVTEFACYDEALEYFLREANVTNAEDYFESRKQLAWGFGEQEDA